MVQPTEKVTAVADQAKPKVNKKVADILNAINNTATVVTAAEATKTVAKKATYPKKKETPVPRGQAKSGRPWKEVKKKYVTNIANTRFSVVHVNRIAHCSIGSATSKRPSSVRPPRRSTHSAPK